jgi:hypothetical protein
MLPRFSQNQLEAFLTPLCLGEAVHAKNSPIFIAIEFGFLMVLHLDDQLNILYLIGGGMKRFIMLLTGCAFVLSGCAPVPYKPIALDETFWQQRQGTIGIAAEPVPESTAHMLGNQGLLDIAINQGNAKKLIERLKTADTQRMKEIPGNLARQLEARGFKVKRLSADFDPKKFPENKPATNPEKFANRDYSKLVTTEEIDRLLLVTVARVGTARGYNGFIPLGPPRASVVITGQIVDLKTNKLLWYSNREVSIPVSEPWDQEPDFQNVMAAVTKGIEDSANQYERSFLTPGELSISKQ